MLLLQVQVILAQQLRRRETDNLNTKTDSDSNRKCSVLVILVRPFFTKKVWVGGLMMGWWWLLVWVRSDPFFFSCSLFHNQAAVPANECVCQPPTMGLMVVRGGHGCG